MSKQIGGISIITGLKVLRLSREWVPAAVVKA